MQLPKHTAKAEAKAADLVEIAHDADRDFIFKSYESV